MRFAAVVAALAVVAACSTPDTVTVDGIVTAVDGDLTTVRSFEVLTTTGETLSLVPAPFGDFDFPLPHLSSHMRSLDPVRVSYTTTEDGVNLAETIVDAPIGATP